MGSDLPDNDAVAAIRDWLREHIDEGCKCPACGQHVELRSRSITPSMAADLVAMTKAIDGAGEVNISQVEDVRGGDYAKLRFWGLIEQTRPGRWRVTQKGMDFVADRCRVPKYVYVYNNRVRDVSEEDVNIRQIMGSVP